MENNKIIVLYKYKTEIGEDQNREKENLMWN